MSAKELPGHAHDCELAVQQGHGEARLNAVGVFVRVVGHQLRKECRGVGGAGQRVREIHARSKLEAFFAYDQRWPFDFVWRKARSQFRDLTSQCPAKCTVTLIGSLVDG